MVMVHYHDFLCLLPSFKVLSNRIGISMYINCISTYISMYIYVYLCISMYINCISMYISMSMLIIMCLDIQFLILLKILEMLHLFVVSTLHNSLERTSPECVGSVVAERESIYYIAIHLEICIYICLYIMYIIVCMYNYVYIYMIPF